MGLYLGWCIHYVEFPKGKPNQQGEDISVGFFDSEKNTLVFECFRAFIV